MNSFTCPECERTSWHPEDVRHGYCGACHAFTGAEHVPCPRCNGCGRLADTETREPWTHWTSLAVGAALAVFLGLVQPIPCTDCAGSGQRPRSEVMRA